MKQLIQKHFFAYAIILVSFFSLSASQRISSFSMSDSDKNLYEMIGLDEVNYWQKRDEALQGISISDMDYDSVIARLQSIPQSKKLLAELKKVKSEIDALTASIQERLDASDLGVGAALAGGMPVGPRAPWSAGEKTIYDKERALRGLNNSYDYLFGQALEAIKENQYKGAFDDWAKKEITSKCKKAHQEQRKEIEKLEQEMKFYPPEQAPQLRRRLSKAKDTLKKISEGCTFLMNSKFRAQYDSMLKAEHRPSVAFETVKDAVESSMRLVGTGTRIKLNAIIGDRLSKELEIPDAATKLFNQDLALTDIRVLPKPRGEDIKYYVGFTGTTVFNAFSLAVNVYLIWDIYNKVRFSIGIATPDQYRLTNLFPKLRALNWMLFPKGKFVVANFNGTDADGYSFKKGLNFLATWDLFSGPLSFFKKLQTAAPKLEGLVFEANPVIVNAHIPKNPLFTELEAKIPLYIGLDFTKMSKLPTAFTRVINSIKLGGLEFKISPSAPTIEKQQEKVGDLETRRDALEKSKQKLESEKASAESAGKVFEKQKELEAAQHAFAIAEKEHRGAARSVEEIKDVIEKKRKAGKRPDESPVPIAQRTGVLPAKSYREDVTKTIRDDAPSAIIQKGLLDQFEKFGFTVRAQAEGVLKLGTQPDPLRLIVSGLVQPPGLKHPQGFISLAARLDNLLEFGWLAIGNAGIVIDIDVAAMEALIAFGIPITGIFINGQLDLGKPGESRASLKAGGGISITAQKPVDALIFDVSGENIRPTDFARFVGYQLMKSQYISKGVGKLSEKGAQLYTRLFPKSGGVPSLSLPEIIFHKVWGYAALGSATIGKQTYRSGLGLQVELELMKKKAGMKIFISDKEKGYALEGFGYGPPLHLSIKGRDLIKLHSTQDPSKGPYITWNFNPKVLFETTPQATHLQTARAGAEAIKEDIIKGGGLSLDAMLELPMMGLKQKAKFAWTGYIINADFETVLAGYTILFGIKMNTRGDEIDEEKYADKFTEVQGKFSKKDSADVNTIAARFLLRAAENKSTKYGMQLLEKASSLLDRARTKPIDPRGITQKARDLYAQGGVSGIFKAGTAELKKVFSEEEEKIPYDKVLEVNAIVQNESMKAEFEALKQEADSLKSQTDESKAALQQLQNKVQTLFGQKAGNREIRRDLNEYRRAVNERLSDIRPTVGLQNWQGTLVTFGFKNVNEISKQISEKLVPYLNRLKDSYSKRIIAVDEKAKRWEAGDIDTTKEKEAIARRETKITQMKTLCAKQSRAAQIVCQSKIKLEQAKLLKDKAILKAFIESKASRDTKRIAAIGYRKAKTGKALKFAGEKALSVVTATVQAIAKGIDILNLKEIVGQYSYRDMINLRLPRLVRLVAELNMMDMHFSIRLQNLQFDFRNPVRSVEAIAHAIFDNIQQNVESELLKDMPKEMRELLHESMGG